MSVIPSTTSRVFWGVNTLFLISGATYASVATIKAKWGFAVHREATTGNSFPYLGTGVFLGEIDIEGLGSSDNRWENATTITSGVGIIPNMTVQWQEKDTQTTQSGRTWTVSGVKFTDRETMWDKDGVVKYKMKGHMALEPLVS